LAILHIATIGLGIISLFLSLSLSFYFIRSQKPIGKAVAFMLFGESVGALVAVVFSIYANGLFDVLGPGVSLLLRWTMFLTAITTSLHLAYQTRMVELEGVSKKNSNGS
jgi:hypothetical protein